MYPTLIKIGSFEITTFGLMMFIAFIVGGWILTRQFRRYGLSEPRGVLLLGIQGCGKSLVAKAVSQAWQMPLLRLDVGRVFGRYIGESEAGIRNATLVQTPSHLVGVVSGGRFRRLYDSRMVASYGYTGKPRLMVPTTVVLSLPTAPLTAR